MTRITLQSLFCDDLCVIVNRNKFVGRPQRLEGEVYTDIQTEFGPLYLGEIRKYATVPAQGRIVLEYVELPAIEEIHYDVVYR